MLGLLLTLGQKTSIFVGQFLLLFGTLSLESVLPALALDEGWSDQTLDSRSLGLGLLALLGGQWSSHNILADIVLLRQVEELSDFVGSLGTETSGNGDIGQTFDFLFT